MDEAVSGGFDALGIALGSKILEAGPEDIGEGGQAGDSKNIRKKGGDDVAEIFAGK